MATYTVKTYINDGPGRFSGYEPGDLLSPGPVLRVDADTSLDALNKAWEIGNHMGADADGAVWPGKTTRSMSVADVLVVGAGGTPKAFAVESFGFKAVIDFHVEVSLSEFARVSDRGGLDAPWVRDPKVPVAP